MQKNNFLLNRMLVGKSESHVETGSGQNPHRSRSSDGNRKSGNLFGFVAKILLSYWKKTFVSLAQLLTNQTSQICPHRKEDTCLLYIVKVNLTKRQLVSKSVSGFILKSALATSIYKMSFHHYIMSKILPLVCKPWQSFFKRCYNLLFLQGFLTPFAFGTSAQILLNLFKRFRGKSQKQIFGKGTFSLGLFLGSFGGLYKVRVPNDLHRQKAKER